MFSLRETRDWVRRSTLFRRTALPGWDAIPFYIAFVTVGRRLGFSTPESLLQGPRFSDLIAKLGVGITTMLVALAAGIVAVLIFRAVRRASFWLFLRMIPDSSSD